MRSRKSAHVIMTEARDLRHMWSGMCCLCHAMPCNAMQVRMSVRGSLEGGAQEWTVASRGFGLSRCRRPNGVSS